MWDIRCILEALLFDIIAQLKERHLLFIASFVFTEDR